MGDTAADVGIVLAPIGILAIALSPWVGRNVARIDARRLTTVAFVVFALVFWMRSYFNTQAGLVTILIPTLVQGGAMALFFIPLASITLSGLPPSSIPIASGLSKFPRITASAFGASL